MKSDNWDQLEDELSENVQEEVDFYNRKKAEIELAKEQSEEQANNNNHLLEQLRDQIPESEWKRIQAAQFRNRSRATFLTENGIVVLTDDRVKRGDTLELQLGIQIVHPESRDEMVKIIESKGFFVRELREKDRARLSHKASVMIEEQLRQNQLVKRKLEGEDKSKNPSAPKLRLVVSNPLPKNSSKRN
jgi:hypothetical protein